MTIHRFTDPPSAPKLPHIPLKRLGPSEKIRCAVTANEVFSTLVHYLGGRTLPCVGKDCPGCSQKRSTRRECYIPVLLTPSRAQIILGVTHGAELNLSDQVHDWHALRGVILEAKRIGPKSNGRVQITVDENRLSPERLPPEPNLTAHLFLIWGIDAESIQPDHPLWDFRDQFTLPEISTNGTGLRTGQPDNSGP